jgi:hypothetical protein
MISFEERYYRAISSSPSSFLSFPSPGSSSSSLTINSISKLSLSDSHSFLFVGHENKILWNEILNHEICTREIQLLHLPELFEINGLWTISIHSKYFLYLSIISRHTPPQASPSTPSSTNANPIITSSTAASLHSSSISSPLTLHCHLLGYEISLSNFSLKPFQEMKLSYSILDLKDFIFDQNLFLCCLGNDQKIHVYEIDSHTGVLSRNSKRAKKARSSLSSRMNNKTTGAATEALPLRFTLEDWLDGGSQCLVGYIDGHLYWDRHVEKLVTAANAAAVGTNSHQGNEESVGSQTTREDRIMNTNSHSPSHSHLVEPTPRTPPQPPPSIELPKSPEIPEAPLDITSPVSTQRSYDASDLMTIEEGSDEDDEDSVDSTLRQYHRSDQPKQPPQNPYLINMSVNLRSPPSPGGKDKKGNNNIWDDMIETDDIPPVPAAAGGAATGEDTNLYQDQANQIIDTKLYETYSKIFLHDPVRSSIVPQKNNSSHPPPSSASSSLRSTVTKKSSYSYLLHGSISCLQFYQREARQLRSFRQKYSSSVPSANSTLYPNHDSCFNSLPSPQTHPTLQSQFSNSTTQLKLKDSFIGRIQEPSSCVLIGSSEGDLALLSLERKVIQSSTYDEATDSLQTHWCWEGGEEEEEECVRDEGNNPFVMKSIFISSSSPSWGSILCVCVADVTGNGLNDIIVGYDTGLVRILSILDSSSPSATTTHSSALGAGGTSDSTEYDHQFHQPTRTPSHSADHDFENSIHAVSSSSFSFPGASSLSSSSLTMNSECWSVSHSSFHEICQLQLPFPVLAIEYGQYLGDPTGTRTDDGGQEKTGGAGGGVTEGKDRLELIDGDRDRARNSRGSGSGSESGSVVSLGPMNHLVIITTKSFHVWIPCQKKDHFHKKTTGEMKTEVEQVNEETLEVLEAKKKLILQIFGQLDQLGEITSQIAV